MRDWIITVMSVAISLVALSLMSLFSLRVRNYRYIDRYLIGVTIFTVIATVIILSAYYEVKQ